MGAAHGALNVTAGGHRGTVTIEKGGRVEAGTRITIQGTAARFMDDSKPLACCALVEQESRIS